MKKDIKTRKDIERLIDTFYEGVKADPLLGPVFNDRAQVNWEKHLPVMYDFWESILFLTNKYMGNPMVVHTNLNERVQFTREHFQRWVALFTGTVDELFEGKKAGIIKEKAISIAAIMETKIVSPFKIVANPGANSPNS